MYLKKVTSGIWKIYAVTSGRGNCELLQFLSGLDSAYEENVNALLALFDDISGKPEGPQGLASKKCHTITSDNKIWQVSVGRLRVAWFYDGDKIMICTHGFFKDSQETKKSDKRRAQNLRNEYLKDKAGKNIAFEE